MKYAIPKDALDDRLGFVGTAGSGKTYNAAASVERILHAGGRVVIPDPLGVWWGLRVMADGKTPSPFNVVIFGGPHGDLALNEHAGAIIGETVAKMAESCILDLSQLGTKAAERRFMLAFLTALYKTKERDADPLHTVFDEADMWAPQRLLDKEGEAAKLLGMMETVVRRGRIKGFIPWLITQRPAVLSKDVLSQIDGLVAFKLTSSQDRDAIGDWVEGQADKAQWLKIWASLPTMQRGTGVVWIPGRGILETVSFPEKNTFDSSRTPKRGEKRKHAELKPLDLDTLKEKLASVQAEAKANDPAALRLEIANLKRQIATTPKSAPTGIGEREHQSAIIQAGKDGEQRGITATKAALADALSSSIAQVVTTLQGLPEKFSGGVVPQKYFPAAKVLPPPVQRRHAQPVQIAAEKSNGSMPPIVRKIIDVIHGAYPVGLTFPAAASRAGVSRHSSAYDKYERYIRDSVELKEENGRFRSADGFARPVQNLDDPIETWAARLPPSYASMLRAIAEAGGNLDRIGVAERARVSPTSSGLSAGLAELKSLALIVERDGYFDLAEGLK